jgi:hypothetical protein
MQTKSRATRRVTFTLPADVMPALQWRAKIEGRSVSNLIAQAVQQMLAGQPSFVAPLHEKVVRPAEEIERSEVVA